MLLYLVIIISINCAEIPSLFVPWCGSSLEVDQQVEVRGQGFVQSSYS